MSVTVKFEFKCDACSTEETRLQSGLIADCHILDRRCIPHGWQWVDYKLLCPRHEVRIDPDDDKTNG